MPELIDIAERIAAQAKPGEQIEAVVVHDHSTEVRAYEGSVEHFVSAESIGVGIRVITGGRQGFAYAGTLDDDVVAETLRDARDNVAFATPDDANGLAVPDGVAPPAIDLYAPGLATFSTDAKIALAIELERLVRSAPRIAGIESADYSDSVVKAALATSTGIRSTSHESSCWVSVYSLASDGDETTTGFGFSVGRDPAQLDIERAAGEAVDRAVRMLGASKPGTDRVTVVLDPWVSAQVLGLIGHMLSADSVIKGRSLFAGRIGESVAAPSVTFIDDPTNPAAIGASRSDGEGLACRPVMLIQDGVLKGFLHNSYTARRMGVASTASAVRSSRSTPGVGLQAAVLKPGTKTRDELIRSVDNGVLIQDVSGLHSGVNPVSGDFSTGAEGMLIRNGVLTEPVREFTIASTLQRLLLDIEAIGNEIEWFPMSAAGVSLVVRDVMMSGQ